MSHKRKRPNYKIKKEEGVAVWRDVGWRGVAGCGAARRGEAWRGVARRGEARRGGEGMARWGKAGWEAGACVLSLAKVCSCILLPG